MKISFTVLCVLATIQIVWADEPPCWCEFSVSSDNKKYRADIEFIKDDSLKNPWDRNWIIKVYEINSNPISLWESEFYHDGYGFGNLSNDGQLYIYVNDWLVTDYPNQVIIYSKNRSIKLSGENLGLDSYNYSYTVSHQTWMEEYRLVPNAMTDTTKLMIKTQDLKKIEIDINSQKIVRSSFHPEYIKQANWLKKLGIGMLLFIGIGILLFIVRKPKSKGQNFK